MLPLVRILPVAKPHCPISGLLARIFTVIGPRVGQRLHYNRNAQPALPPFSPSGINSAKMLKRLPILACRPPPS